MDRVVAQVEEPTFVIDHLATGESESQVFQRPFHFLPAALPTFMEWTKG